MKFGSQMYDVINLAITLVFVWSWLELAKVSKTFYQTHGLLVPNGNEMNVLQHESTQKLHPRKNKHNHLKASWDCNQLLEQLSLFIKVLYRATNELEDVTAPENF